MYAGNVAVDDVYIDIGEGEILRFFSARQSGKDCDDRYIADVGASHLDAGRGIPWRQKKRARCGDNRFVLRRNLWTRPPWAARFKALWRLVKEVIVGPHASGTQSKRSYQDAYGKR